MRIVILGAALWFATGAAQLIAATYYVDYAAGIDLNDGRSTNSAWRHCPGDPAANAAPATCTLTPGDTVIFKGGVTYQFTGATGITLAWDGVSGSAITYDGNSAGTWGSGHARFTDNRSANALTAFVSDGARHDLVFRSLDFTAIGGASTLPADPGTPLPSRYGGGIAFRGGATNVQITDCSFSELGYWFNQRPMSRASIAGAGIVCAFACRGLSIANCTFSRVADGCDFSRATELSQMKIESCTFRDSVVWPFDLPARAMGVTLDATAVQGCIVTDNAQFDAGTWAGYGYAPRAVLSTVSAGSTISWLATAMATPAASFQWCKNGVAIPGATSAMLTLATVSPLDAGIYTAVATNEAGSELSNAIVLIVPPDAVASATSPATAPILIAQPASQIASASATVTFTALAAGTPAPTYQWQRNGLTFAGWTDATLVLPALTANDNGTYRVIATNSAGSTTSHDASLTVLAASSAPPASVASVAPAFTLEPVSEIASALSTIALIASATGTPAPSYQWFKNGVAIVGWTSSTLVLPALTTNDNAAYSVVATNSVGSTTSRAAMLTVLDGSFKNSGLQPTKVLVSSPITIGQQAQKISFVVDGNGPHQVLVRALGPALTAFGVAGMLGDPRLEIQRDGMELVENDNWGGDAALRDAASQAGALPLTDPASKDSAVLVTLRPGTYTAVVSAANDSIGTALVDVYELP